MKGNAIPTIPFERPEARDFITAVKAGDYKTVSNFLIMNRFLVHDFDQARETALHWAAKRQYGKIMKLLLEKGADPDAKDMVRKYYKCMIDLLIGWKNPTVFSRKRFKPCLCQGNLYNLS